MIYYTADLHFHYALLLPSRPFATVEEMEETLGKNWNDTVPQAGLHDPRTPPPRAGPGL